MLGKGSKARERTKKANKEIKNVRATVKQKSESPKQTIEQSSLIGEEGVLLSSMLSTLASSFSFDMEVNGGRVFFEKVLLIKEHSLNCRVLQQFIDIHKIIMYIWVL